MYVVKVTDPAASRVHPSVHPNAYALPDSVIDWLVDRGEDVVVFSEPTRRLVSETADWQTLGFAWNDGETAWTVLPVRFMGA